MRRVRRLRRDRCGISDVIDRVEQLGADHAGVVVRRQRIARHPDDLPDRRWIRAEPSAPQPFADHHGRPGIGREVVPVIDIMESLPAAQEAIDFRDSIS